MAFTTDDVASLDRAIAAGVRSVRFSDGRSVEYQDMAALLAARDRVAALLPAAPGDQGRTTYTTFSRD